MDIPDTGAVFTLGKSYLAENAQSYFFIKNDPVKKLISGTYQSAVICDSGRLFVWGENQFGQLGIGGSSINTDGGTSNNNSNENNNEIVTKPTCVKSLKTIGLKVNDAVFGIGWCVILTTTNEIFFTGRNIFPKETKVYKNFELTTSENLPIVRKPFRLAEFNGILKESEDNEESFDKLSAGNEHFVLLTSTGRLFGWGSNKFNQLGLPAKELLAPVELSPDIRIINFECGPQSTLIQTETNQFFLSGQLNDFHYSTFTQLNLNNISHEVITFLHISPSNEIFVTTEKGNVYRSNESIRTQNLLFQRFYDYNNEENGPVVKILKASSFFATLTRDYKLFTTFSESGHHLKTFREISKFKNLRVFDVAVGYRHVLIMGILRSVKNYDRNRFFNKIVAINTPDLNGNLIEKIGSAAKKVVLDNDNKIENEIKKIESKISAKDEIKNIETGKNNENGFINKVDDININEVEVRSTKLSQNNEKEQKQINAETKSPKSDGDFNESKKEPSSSTPSEKTKYSPLTTAHKDKQNLENEPKKLEVEENNHEIQNDELKEKSPVIQNGKNSQPVDENYFEDQQQPNKIKNVQDTSSKSKQSPKSNDNSIIIPNGPIENSISLKNMEKQESKNFSSPTKLNESDFSSLSTSTDLPNTNNKNQTPGKKIINETSKTPAKIEEKETTSNSTADTFKTSTIAEAQKEANQKSPPKEFFCKTPPVTPNNKNDDLSKSLEFKKSSPLQEQQTDGNHPSPLQKSRKGSARSIKFDEKSLKSVKSQDRLIRPNTPYPDDTPKTLKRVQSIVQSSHDMIENTSPNLTDSLENIPEISPQNSSSVKHHRVSAGKEKESSETVKKLPKKPSVIVNEQYVRLNDDDDDDENDDEKLEIEIKTDQTVNEIRFINNGIDVTEEIRNESESKLDGVGVQEFEEKSFGIINSSKLGESDDGNYQNNQLNVVKSNLKTTENEFNSRDESKVKTIDDDERTTASINSNKNGNQFDNDADYKNDKQNRQNTLLEGNIQRQQQRDEHQLQIEQYDSNLKEPKKKRMQRFIDDLKSKGKEMSCRADQSVRVEGDPPTYGDERLDPKTSKVCTIF